MSKLDQPCYQEKGLDHCECGRELWETYRYCDKMGLLQRETILPTEREIIIMEFRMAVLQRAKGWPQGMMDELIKILYQS